MTYLRSRLPGPAVLLFDLEASMSQQDSGRTIRMSCANSTVVQNAQEIKILADVCREDL